MLASDFGSNPNNPWQSAIDLTVTARAARREASGSLYFFIDACRQTKTEALMPGAAAMPLQTVNFKRPVLCNSRLMLWATGEGKPAFGAKDAVRASRPH